MPPFCQGDLADAEGEMLTATVNGKPALGQLRDLRRRAGLSQERLAHRADCSLSMVKLLERGYVPERSDVLDRIAAVLSSTNEGAGAGPLAKHGDAPPRANPT